MFQGLEMKVTCLYGLALTPASVEISSPYTMYIYTVIIFFYVFFRPLFPLFYWLSHYAFIGHQRGYNVHVTVYWLVFYAVAQ